MILALSGAQGQGKTTLLKTLETKGYNVEYNTNARNTLIEMGMTLTEVYSNPESAKEFQDRILVGQEQIDNRLNKLDGVIITERSYADIFTYALFALGNLNTYDKWLSDYYDKCVALQCNYNHVVFLTGRIYTPEDDGVRSTNTQFGNSVDLVLEHYTRELCSFPTTYRHLAYTDMDMCVNSIITILEGDS